MRKAEMTKYIKRRLVVEGDESLDDLITAYRFLRAYEGKDTGPAVITIDPHRLLGGARGGR